MDTVEIAGVLIDTRHYIDGQRVASVETFENTSPIDGSFLGHFSRAGASEVDTAVVAAKAAFPEWRELGPKGRGDKLSPLWKSSFGGNDCSINLRCSCA